MSFFISLLSHPEGFQIAPFKIDDHVRVIVFQIPWNKGRQLALDRSLFQAQTVLDRLAGRPHRGKKDLVSLHV